MTRINKHVIEYHIDGNVCALCDEIWPCPNVREAGYVNEEPVPRRVMSDVDDFENEGGAVKPDAIIPDKPQTEHEELMEILGAIFVQLSRVYDAVMLTLPSEVRDAMSDVHEAGELYGSPPTLKENAWE